MNTLPPRYYMFNVVRLYLGSIPLVLGPFPSILIPITYLQLLIFVVVFNIIQQGWCSGSAVPCCPVAGGDDVQMSVLTAHCR